MHGGVSSGESQVMFPGKFSGKFQEMFQEIILRKQGTPHPHAGP
jgi:hypothetical protein